MTGEGQRVERTPIPARESAKDKLSENKGKTGAGIRILEKER